MGRYQFELARRTDDAELRSLLAATPMEGQIALSFRREPSFFDALLAEQQFRQVIVCRDSEAGRIVGFGCRAVRSMYVNGKPTPIGYLSALRVLPEYRNRGLIARGYRFLRQLHSDGRTPLYLTTIAEGNEQALSMLTSGRAGLPMYRFAGTYHTVVISLRRRRIARSKSGTVDLRPATKEDRQDLLQFLRETGRERQFFPCYEADEFFDDACTMRDLAPSDLLLAVRGGQVVGTLGGWDQHAYKQSIVERYAPKLQWTRPLYNSWARLCGWPRLPRPGTSFRYLTAALPLALHDDPDVFVAMLEGLLARGSRGACDFLVIGLHESDPLLPLVQPFQSGSYLTRIYLVCWDEGEQQLPKLDGRPPYLELGCL